MVTQGAAGVFCDKTERRRFWLMAASFVSGITATLIVFSDNFALLLAKYVVELHAIIFDNLLVNLIHAWFLNRRLYVRITYLCMSVYELL